MSQPPLRDRVQAWTRGRAAVDAAGRFTLASRPFTPRDKIREAYRWIVHSGLRTAWRDLIVGGSAPIDGLEGPQAAADQAEAYSAFVLLPLLNLMVGRRVVIVGAPGRGKTSVATLMGLLAGDDLRTVRRHVQHGHPQLTVADLLGSPLPGDLVDARGDAEVPVRWRRWLRRRVKIVDEYNRIPTKTQSALLSLMADGYAEQYEQVLEAGPSAWFLTANDAQGGGTFAVIDALRDRIDVVVRCSPFHARHAATLVDRVRAGQRPEDLLPSALVLAPAELVAAEAEIRALPFDPDALDVLGFFCEQIDFCRMASPTLAGMHKDTLHLAGRRVAHVCTEDCPLDKAAHGCSQTDNGVSPRAWQALLTFAQALTWFRGGDEVGLAEIQALVPWVLHDKVRPNLQSGFFLTLEHRVYENDRAAWLTRLFAQSVEQHARYAPTRQATTELLTQAPDADRGALEALRGWLARAQARQRLLSAEHELSAPVHADLVALAEAIGGVRLAIAAREAPR